MLVAMMLRAPPSPARARRSGRSRIAERRAKRSASSTARAFWAGLSRRQDDHARHVSGRRLQMLSVSRAKARSWVSTYPRCSIRLVELSLIACPLASMTDAEWLTQRRLSPVRCAAWPAARPARPARQGRPAPGP
ncbi:hypothetical protein AB5I41_01060 [Sphingomonas sp. MMS24-JH45]